MKTLYISDLDGTLLDQEALLAEDTQQALQEIIAAGIHFTCATARTAATVTHILSGLNLSAPAILMNGVAILDWHTHDYVKVEYLQSQFSKCLIEKLAELKLTSFIYSIKDNQLFTYYDTLYNEAMYQFYYERVTRYQKPYTKVSTLREIDSETMIYSLLLDKKEVLQPLIDWLTHVKGDYPIEFCFYPEVYLQDTWCLEIFSNKATKYNAVQFLRENYHYDTIIGFGDNLNDLALFKACDQAYAVRNAKDAVKAAATDIIASNLEGGVPKFIKKREHLE